MPSDSRSARDTSVPIDRIALRRALDRGLDDLGLPLDDAARDRLLDYLGLLSKWNAVYNLTAIRNPDSMLVQHLLDSLAIVGPLAGQGPFTTIVDVGSGGGLPGIVLAIAWPQATVHLVEPVGKKAAFLRQCLSELALAHAKVHTRRVESLSDREISSPDLIVCRAFASLRDFVSGIEALVGPKTVVAAMKGSLPVDEIAALPAGWQVGRVVRLTVPGLDAQRHLLLLERATVQAGRPDCSDAATADQPATPER